MIEHIQYSRLVHTFGIFANIFFVISDELPLDFERSLKGSLCDEVTNDSRHASQNAVVEEKLAAH